MKNKLVNKFLAATAFGVAFANASLTANAEELPDESAVTSEQEDSGQEENSQEQEDIASDNETSSGGDNQEQAGDDERQEPSLPETRQEQSGGQSSDKSGNTVTEGNKGQEENDSDEQQSQDQTEEAEKGEDQTQSPDLSDSDQEGEVKEPSESGNNEIQETGPANFEEAKENLDKAKEEEAQAKSELNQAQTDADNAQTDVDNAKQEAQDAETELNQAQEKKEEAEEQKKKADEEVENTKADVTKAEENLGSALKDAQADGIDTEQFESSQQELEEKKEQEETARQAAEAAEADCNDKKKKSEEASAAKEEAQKAVESAQKDKDAADQEVSDAQEKVNSAQKEYEEVVEEVGVDAAAVEAAQKKLDEAKKILDAAVQKINSGTLGFFQNLASQGSASAKAAVSILTAKKESEVPGLNTDSWAVGSWEEFISYTHIGAENDATSLENMRKVFDYIEECNRLRKSDNNFKGLSDLYVNDALMAIAQLNANWAINYIAHSQVFNTGENLAWGYSGYDPFDGWYTEEKKYYDAGHKEWDSQNGHYLNIVKSDYLATGYGMNSVPGGDYAIAHAQEFNSKDIINYYGYGTSYTLSEYKERFMTYYDSVMKELSDAQAKYDAAKAAYDEAVGDAKNLALINSKKAELDKATAVLEAAKENAQEKIEILQSAKEVLEASSQKYEVAQAAYEESKANLEIAKNDLKEKEKLYQDALNDIKTTYGGPVAEAADNLANAKSAYGKAQANQEKAAKELSSAEEVWTVAADKKALADQHLQEKTDILDQKLKVLQEAKDAYYEALANLAVAQADYDRLKPKENGSSNSYVEAEYSETFYAEEYIAQENFGNVIISDLSSGNSRKATFIKGCSFKYFLDYTYSFIKECPFDHLIIDCSDTSWFSLNKKTLEALKNNPGKSLTIIFRYKGKKYTFTIPSGYDLNLLQDSNGWYGFMYLKMIFGGHEVDEVV